MKRDDQLRARNFRVGRGILPGAFCKSNFQVWHRHRALCGPCFDADELVKLVDSSLDFFLTASRYSDQFETEFAEYFELSNAFIVNSGSSANLDCNHIADIPKLGERSLKPGDEVITVAAGFPTTVAPIVQNQLMPVFVDVNLGDYTAIPSRIEEAIGPKTRAIVMAHTMGVPFDLDTVMSISKST